MPACHEHESCDERRRRRWGKLCSRLRCAVFAAASLDQHMPIRASAQGLCIYRLREHHHHLSPSAASPPPSRSSNHSRIPPLSTPRPPSASARPRRAQCQRRQSASDTNPLGTWDARHSRSSSRAARSKPWLPLHSAVPRASHRKPNPPPVPPNPYHASEPTAWSSPRHDWNSVSHNINTSHAAGPADAPAACALASTTPCHTTQHPPPRARLIRRRPRLLRAAHWYSQSRTSASRPSPSPQPKRRAACQTSQHERCTNHYRNWRNTYPPATILAS